MSVALVIIAVQLALFAVFVRNRMTLRPISSCVEPSPASSEAMVSLLIPARNEERVIRHVVEACLAQDWDHVEVLVLDDGSEDQTGRILSEMIDHKGSRLRVIHGVERPSGWLGKPWACQQLSHHAKGDILVFLDADTKPSSVLARSIAVEFESNGEGLVTVWPQQYVLTPWEKIIVPLVYFTLLGFLVTDYTRRDPRWMPTPFRKPFRPLFAAACGQCLALPKQVYDRIGGHELVKSDVVEDVGIARAVRALQLPVRMYHGVDGISCRMYQNHHEIFEGFRKNFLAGFGGNVFVFVLAAILHVVLFMLPPAALVGSFWIPGLGPSYLWLAASAIPIFMRWLLNVWMRWEPWTALTHWIGVIWFQWLGIVVLVDRIMGRSVSWKGRDINAR